MPLVSHVKKSLPQKTRRLLVGLLPTAAFFGACSLVAHFHEVAENNKQNMALSMVTQAACAQKSVDKIMRDNPNSVVIYSHARNDSKSLGDFHLMSEEKRQLGPDTSEVVSYTVSSANKKYTIPTKTVFHLAARKENGDELSVRIDIYVDKKGNISSSSPDDADDYIFDHHPYGSLIDTDAKTLQQTYLQCMSEIYKGDGNLKSLTVQPVFGNNS